jgi:hypothetical protein
VSEADSDNSSPTLADLHRAARGRWAGEHVIVSESYDGLLTLCHVFIDRGEEVIPVVETNSRQALLLAIQGEENTAP